MNAWIEATTAVSYATDPHGYRRKMSAHGWEVFWGTALVSGVLHLIIGEFANKLVLFSIMVVLLTAWKVLEAPRGKEPKTAFDRFEEWWVSVFYAAAPIIFLFDEVQPGSGQAITNVFYAMPVMAVFAGHIGVGMLARAYNRRRAEQEALDA